MRRDDSLKRRAGGSPGGGSKRAEGEFFMNELHVLYTFLALMTFNLLASFIYILGFGSMREAVKKAVHREARK